MLSRAYLQEKKTFRDAGKGLNVTSIERAQSGSSSSARHLTVSEGAGAGAEDRHHDGRLHFDARCGWRSHSFRFARPDLRGRGLAPHRRVSSVLQPLIST